jgi:iron(III) transport system substrate-binding protein
VEALPVTGRALRLSALTLSALTLSALTLFLLSCSSTSREVVIYTSVDQVYAEPVLDGFEKRTGIHVRAVFDVEAAKTTGLVQRLIAERGRPRADVFWSGEIAQTIGLEKAGVLAPYRSPAARDIPARFVDPGGYWTGFAPRARVILVNTRLVDSSRQPRSLNDFLDTRWPGEKLGIAYPLFGTTATHAAALYALWGPERGLAFFQALAKRKIRVLAGNSVVKDKVASGELLFGLTDSDDAARAIEGGAPVRVVVPDQGVGETGTLLIPNTVALVKGGPHPDVGRIMIDYLASREVESGLAKQGWTHFPVRPLGEGSSRLPGTVPEIKALDVGYDDVYKQLERVAPELRELFVSS